MHSTSAAYSSWGPAVQIMARVVHNTDTIPTLLHEQRHLLLISRIIVRSLLSKHPGELFVGHSAHIFLTV